MPAKIKLLLVDDSYQVRQSVKAMLELESGEFQVLGEAENGQQAVDMTKALLPDVVLMDINMPVLDGIAATTRIMQECPAGVVIISVQGEQEYLRRAMKAGARDFLIKPFTHEELVGALRSAAAMAAYSPRPASAGPVAGSPVKKQAKVITVFSTKGGVGKTTLVANLAAALAKGGELKVAAVDLDLEFGVLTTMMGIRPQASVVDLCRLNTKITPEHVERVMSRQAQSGVSVLSAPPLPHLAAEVEGNGRADTSRSYITEILEALRSTHDFVVIDTAASFREVNLISFDKSDLILLVTLPEITALESSAKGLDVLLERLEYPKEKVQVVLNRSDSSMGLTHADIAASLGVPLTHLIPSDGLAAVTAANTGIPVVLNRARRSQMIEALQKMALFVATGEQTGGEDPPGPPPSSRPPVGMRRLFGLLSS